MPDSTARVPLSEGLNQTNSSGPLIVAHRGSSAFAPENTRAAFRRAIEEGADGIEFDVRRAGDGVPVVFHDPTLERTGRMSARVSEMTSVQLSEVDVGSWFNDMYPDRAKSIYAAERVPTLADTLLQLNSFKGRIYIELKCGDSEIESLCRNVCEIIADSPLRSQLVIKSFKLGVIPFVRYACPGVRTAALFAPQIMRFLRKEKHIVKIAEEFGADELSVHYSLVSRKLMKKVAKRSMPVAIWTADSPGWIRRGTTLGLRAIITNYPALLIAARNEFDLAGRPQNSQSN
jgi:glycerophosphoryl diester phosphodiesterase